MNELLNHTLELNSFGNKRLIKDFSIMTYKELGKQEEKDKKLYDKEFNELKDGDKPELDIINEEMKSESINSDNTRDYLDRFANQLNSVN